MDIYVQSRAEKRSFIHIAKVEFTRAYNEQHAVRGQAVWHVSIIRLLQLEHGAAVAHIEFDSTKICS